MKTLALEVWKARAFFLRDLKLATQDGGLFLAMLFYTVASSLAIVLIGNTDPQQRLSLFAGCVVWTCLSSLYSELGYSLAQEALEGVLEETLSAPVHRLIHLGGISLFAYCKALLESLVVAVAVWPLVGVPISWTALVTGVGLLAIGGISFIGFGLVVAALPLISAERGYQTGYVVQGMLLLISGVFCPTHMLPYGLWLASRVSPATYVLEGVRTIFAVETPQILSESAYIGSETILPELKMVVVLGLASLVLGAIFFNAVEEWAKRSGRLKRQG